MKPSAEQQVAFEALLAQSRRLAGSEADRLETGLRGMWQTVEDPESMLRAMAEDLRSLRDRRASESEGAHEDPGPS